MLELRKFEMGKVLGVEDRLKIGEEFINVSNERRKRKFEWEKRERICWNEVEKETEVEVEDILEKIRIKVELGKEMEVETETDKEFDSCIVGDTLR